MKCYAWVLLDEFELWNGEYESGAGRAIDEERELPLTLQNESGRRQFGKEWTGDLDKCTDGCGLSATQAAIRVAA